MHFGMNFKRPSERQESQSASPPPIIPPSFLCFYNKDSLSHPITSCLSPVLSPDVLDSWSGSVCDPPRRARINSITQPLSESCNHSVTREGFLQINY